jgi:CHAT domain-containing protein/Tfp pilus assembly protein PilF
MKKVLTCGFLICGLILSFAAACFGQIHNLQEVSPERKITALEPGQVIEREIGEPDFYRIKLDAGQFVKIEVEQTDCDVVLMFISPDGQNLQEVRNQTSGRGIETAEAAVTSAGEYELRVLPFSAPSPTSRYALKIAELRAATQKELDFTAGIALFNDAFNLGTSSAPAEALRKAIRLFEEATEKFRAAGSVYKQSLSLNNIAVSYNRLGNRKKAIEYIRRALEGYRSIDAKAEVAWQLRNLGTVYTTVGEWQKAFAALTKSLAVSVELGDRRGEAFTLSRTGFLYEAIGDLEKAENFYRRAAEIFREFDEHHNEALEENRIGKVLYESGNFAAALKHFERALELARLAKELKTMSLETGIKRTEAMLYGNIGRTFFALGEREKGLRFLNDALEIHRLLGLKIGEAAALRYLGQIHYSIGEIDKALEFLNEAAEIYGAVEDTQSVAETLLLAAKTRARKGDLDAAQTDAEEAVRLIETLRQGVHTARLRDSFSANLQDFYGVYIEILMRKHAAAPDKNFAVRAFEANEKRKARGLLNLLTESNVDIRQGIDAKLLEKETELRDLLSARLEILTKVLSGRSKPETVEKLKIEIERINSEYEQVRAEIRASSPRYAALTQPETLDLKTIQREVLDERSVLLEYALGEEKSYLWLVSRNDFRVVELPARAEIERAARAFYDALTARNKQIKFETASERAGRILKADAELQKYSKKLGAMILGFEQAASLLENKRLLIVADGALQYVPFAALRTENSKTGNRGSEDREAEDEASYLIETNEIVYLPSASALAVLRNETADRKAPEKVLAVLADPIFDTEDARFQAIAGKNKPKKEYIAASAASTRSGLDLPRLPFTRREADLISSYIPEDKREKLLDFAAAKEAAMSPNLSNFQFIHFATHGFVNVENPELSGIVLSMIDKTGKEIDGFLRVGDIYNLKLPAEMIVLSGCRTGLGKEIKGEGLIGLTRGFMYAGAKRVTVSLWDVNDQATSVLMANFYKEMLGAKKLPPAAGLREAQLSMIKSREWNNPYFWSAFVLQGEPR